VEAIDVVTEAFVVGIDGPGGAYWMPMFVTLAEGTELDDTLVESIRTRIRTRLSPRHVPDDVIAAPGIPHTRTGKKLEVPVTAIMAGHAGVSLDPRAIDNPNLVDWYREQGRAHRW
jgi:acetoacetyl-CoA synthetase